LILQTRITDQPIDVAAVLAAVGSDADGAVVLFLGTVRHDNEGRAVTGLHYDAYRDLAERVLREIAAEAAAQAGSDRIAAVHRIGTLTVGEVSVAIAISTAHRAEAFAAARYIIEEIKKRLPIWKKERYASGDEEWLGGHPARAGVTS
jgi:molybdopterin synthase catalytic subunit